MNLCILYAVIVISVRYLSLASIDGFHGNSGSAVVNTHTLEVEGILVRGHKDFIYNARRKCAEVSVTPDQPDGEC